MPDSDTIVESDSLRAFLGSLATERTSELNRDLDLMSTAELVRAMNEQDATVATAVAAAAAQIAAAVDGIVERMCAGGRLLYVGAGTAGRMGILDASEAPPTFGTEPGLVVGVIAGGAAAVSSATENAEDDVQAGVDDLRRLGVTALDAVVGISASGRSPYVLGAMGEAAHAGAFTVGLACNAASPLARAAAVGIEVEVGPEILAGSTRLKAGTAQKMVLNMLSTIAMVRLGRTYGNLMVDMRASNEKLRARAESMVMQVAGVDAATAARTLAEADGSVKVAILMCVARLAPQPARRLLAEHGGRLRQAIQAASSCDRGSADAG